MKPRLRGANGRFKAPLKVHDEASAIVGQRKTRANAGVHGIFTVPEFPKGVAPKATLANDSALTSFGSWAWGALNGMVQEGQTFLGYPYLAELSQRPEYRRMVEQMSFHMTRRWIRLKRKSAKATEAQHRGYDDKGMLDPEKKFQQTKDKDFRDGSEKDPKAAKDEFPPKKPADANAGPSGAKGPDDSGLNGEQRLNAAGEPHVEPEFTQEDLERDQDAAKLRELEDELKRLRVKQHFKEIVEQDGFFGRGHIYIDLGTTDSGDELATPIGNGRNEATLSKVAKGSVKGLKTVEPVWVYPMTYNAMDPLSPEWYRPEHWYVMRRQVHRSRLLTFVAREVPDLLKPAYAFGGLPLTQMAKPYVDNWLRTRQSVSDLLQSFTQFVLKTDLLAALATSDGALAFSKRLDSFVATRDNRAVMAVDKDKEDLANISAPLSSLDALQAQSQEQMCSVSGIPILFLLGDQPTGLNASSEGAIRAFYDWIHAQQEFLFERALDAVLGFAMMNIWGKVDEDITYEFVKLWTPTDKELAEQRKADADRDVAYIAEGVLAPDEVRENLANDPNSGYTLDMSRKVVPPAPEPPPMPGLPNAKPGEPPKPGVKPNGAGQQGKPGAKGAAAQN